MKILREYIFVRLAASYGITAISIGALLWLLELLEGLENGVGSLLDLLLLAVDAAQVLPEGLIDLLPVITVLATASAMGALQVRNELTVMRAAGVSLWRLTGLALVPGLLAAALALACLEWVTPDLQQSPERLVGASLGESGLWDPAHGLWVRRADEFLNVQNLYLGRIPTDVNLYRFAPDGGLINHTEAERALVNVDGSWLLENVTVRDYQADVGDQVRQFEQQRWDSFLTARQLELLLSPPANLSLSDLWQYVAALNERDQEVAEFEMILWRRLALPLSCLGMVLAAMATAAVPLKSRAVSVRLVAALTLGLGFQMLAELISYLGLVLAWPVIFAAIGPALMLTVLSWWLLKKAR
ncbi:MAG: LPS export ABC transporter permease LptG [Wenzhouxiangella sp.]|nr:LPS export ABC transporter permease LptG [Wenzhouxiangella sp.]